MGNFLSLRGGILRPTGWYLGPTEGGEREEERKRERNNEEKKKRKGQGKIGDEGK